MTLWFSIAALLGLSLFWLLRALARPPKAHDTGADAAFYRAQFAEIDRQSALGQIGVEEAESARTEAARRLLAAQKLEGQGGDAAPKSRTRIASFLMLVLVPLIALPLYLHLGNPSLPDQPLASRQGGSAANLDIETAVARIEAHLASHPEDGQGHAVLAPVYMRLGRFEDAARSFQNAIRLLGPSAGLWAEYGEALVAQQDGLINVEAKEAMEKALALDPKLLKARFYLAQAAAQDGDRPRALAMLKAMRADAQDDAQRARLDAEIARLDPAAIAAAPGSAEALAQLPEEQRLAAIRSMVEGLDQRLTKEGGALEDWQKLLRAYQVLGEPDKLAAAIARARTALGADAVATRGLEDYISAMSAPKKPEN